MKTILLLAPLSLFAANAEIDLAGEWNLSDGETSLVAQIPGGVHDALLEAGIISDIYWGANETNQLWVARRDWEFERSFEVPEEFLEKKEIILRLEDCDAFATVKINGRKVGETTDRFQRYDFDAKPYLKAGRNEIEGFFRSPVKVADERREKIGRPYPISNPIWAKNQALVRKNACHAGWDWGPEVESIGFCGTVKLIASDGPRIDYLYTEQEFNDDLTHCSLKVIADLSDGTSVTNRMELENPPLWWPNGAGEQKFFLLKTDIAGEHIEKRIGLRKLEVLNERTKSADGKDELSLVFKVNNRRLFMKGANWIPCDALERRQTKEKYKNLLTSAKEANMNMIRVWGGGQYEKDEFYDMCDEMGILIWHDMMFSCAVYPAEEWFLDEVRGELKHQLRRLRDHASIAMWCGDNECLGAINWFDETKDRLDFYRGEWVKRSKMQAEAVAKYDPQRTYWPSSPCCGPGDFGNAWKDDSKGDMHQWDVWHDNKPFEKYHDYRPRFCSEFGFQSFSSPEVAKTYSGGPGEDFEWHQKNIGGNKRIRETMLRYFGRAKDFESELVLSQFQQGLAIKTAVESWRAEMPRTMGTLYWQLNDNWPVASWSSLEYGGKWKPLHYMARRFYAPLAVVVKPDGSIVAINESAEELKGVLTVEYWAYDGSAPKEEVIKDVVLKPEGATKIGTLEHKEGLFAAITLRAGGGVAHNDSVPYRKASLAKPGIKVAVNGNEVTLTTEKPAFFVWLNAEGVKGEFSDNAFTLLPGHARTISFSGDAEEMAKKLKVISLADTL